MNQLTKILVLLGFAFPLTAQAITLEEVIKVVKESHPAIGAAADDATSARYKKRRDSWLPDPELEIVFDQVGASNSSLGNADMTNYSVRQNIPFPTKLASKSRALKAEAKAKDAVLDATVLNQIFEAKKLFYSWVSVENQIRLKREVQKAYTQLSVSAEGEYKTGPTHDTGSMSFGSNLKSSRLSDVLMMRMKDAETRAEIDDLNHQREALRAQINLMMGRDPKSKLSSPSKPNLKKLKLKFDDLEKKFLAGNPDLKGFSWMVEKQRKDLSLARQEYLPDFSPVVTYNQRQNKQNAYTFGVGMSLPLWLNTKSAGVSAAKADLSRSQNELANQKLSLREEFAYLYEHAVWHHKMVSRYAGEILPLAKASYSTVSVAYEAGLTTSTDALQKLVAYHEANRSYWELWRDYQIEFAMLEKLVGEEL